MKLLDNGHQPLPMRALRVLQATVVITAGTTAACGTNVVVAPPSCSTTSAPSLTSLGLGDTLEVVVHLQEGVEADILLRVDGRAEKGGLANLDDDLPPGAAAVGATTSTSGRFGVCFSPNPTTIEFADVSAPHGRVWIRATTDRPVRVRTADASLQVTVPPGTSGQASAGEDLP